MAEDHFKGNAMTYRDVFVREVRVSYHQTSEELFDIRSPQDVATFVRKVLTDNSREHMVALFLSGSHAVASFSVVSIGTANSALVHPREVFQRAISCGAVALVLCHTHPSGNTTPSDEDVRTTKKLKEAGELLGITLLDHVIITDSAFHSMKENGLW